jgi:hypothetical protein
MDPSNWFEGMIVFNAASNSMYGKFCLLQTALESMKMMKPLVTIGAV